MMNYGIILYLPIPFLGIAADGYLRHDVQDVYYVPTSCYYRLDVLVLSIIIIIMCLDDL